MDYHKLNTTSDRAENLQLGFPSFPLNCHCTTHNPASPPSTTSLRLLRAALSSPYPPSSPSSPPLKFNLETAPVESLLSTHPTVGSRPTSLEGVSRLAAQNPQALKYPIVVDWHGGKAAVGDVEGVKSILEELRKKRDGELDVTDNADQPGAWFSLAMTCGDCELQVDLTTWFGMRRCLHRVGVLGHANAATTTVPAPDRANGCPAHIPVPAQASIDGITKLSLGAILLETVFSSIYKSRGMLGLVDAHTFSATIYVTALSSGACERIEYTSGSCNATGFEFNSTLGWVPPLSVPRPRVRLNNHRRMEEQVVGLYPLFGTYTPRRPIVFSSLHRSRDWSPTNVVSFPTSTSVAGIMARLDRASKSKSSGLAVSSAKGVEARINWPPRSLIDTGVASTLECDECARCLYAAHRPSMTVGVVQTQSRFPDAAGDGSACPVSPTLADLVSMFMQLSAFFSGLVLVSVACAVVVPTIPDEGAYSVKNLEGLSDKPTDLTKPVAVQLLDVLEKYGLTDAFGVVGVHSHVQLANGQVMFQTGNSTYIHQGIASYDEVKSSGVPYNYRISSSGELLPLDLGTITDDVIAARKELAAATSGGSFLTEFASVSNGLLTGIAYIRPLDRAALMNNSVVKNHYNLAKTEGTAAAIPAASADPNDAPSFFTRGISNSTAAADLTILCEICGHGNPWQDRRFF
ncbi:hypothetical protein A0H81_05243 [Grifola frondosa]|uniref:Uncharacterized protein n=1 Tax=Grifola frondosa TaxID=5627 RepID=A0A1C7MDV5_GRIFR|nr:hypothetical protein A0H81_05243 [Grifola frondosa]